MSPAAVSASPAPLTGGALVSHSRATPRAPAAITPSIGSDPARHRAGRSRCAADARGVAAWGAVLGPAAAVRGAPAGASGGIGAGRGRGAVRGRVVLVTAVSRAALRPA